jgi:hypothetical protein
LRTRQSELAGFCFYWTLSYRLARRIGISQTQLGGIREMFAKEILEYKDVLNNSELAGELLKAGHWIVAYVDPAMAWPVRPQKINYSEMDFFIIPVTKDARPAVAVKNYNEEDHIIRERIARFLSVLSWIDGHGVLVESFGGGGRLIQYAKQYQGGSIICEMLDLRYLPVVADQRAALALALMREGRSLRHPAYSFLSFWRVLEVALSKPEIVSWVNESLAKLKKRSGSEVVEKIRNSGVTNIGQHLYVSGRCAIAHGSSDPIIDPDQPEDTSRLWQERPLAEALAELAIEEILGVKTSGTIFDEHLYELSGFKEIFGDELVAKIANREKLPEDAVINLPAIDFSIIGRDKIRSFKGLKPISIEIEDAAVKLSYEKPNGMLRLVFRLNFEIERLEFDIHNGIYGIPDNGSPDFAESKADTQEFAKWYYLNGCLQLTDSETGKLIARKDEFIPVNVIVEPKGFDQEITDWRNEAENRRKKIR